MKDINNIQDAAEKVIYYIENYTVYKSQLYQYITENFNFFLPYHIRINGSMIWDNHKNNNKQLYDTIKIKDKNEKIERIELWYMENEDSVYKYLNFYTTLKDAKNDCFLKNLAKIENSLEIYYSHNHAISHIVGEYALKNNLLINEARKKYKEELGNITEINKNKWYICTLEKDCETSYNLKLIFNKIVKDNKLELYLYLVSIQSIKDNKIENIKNVELVKSYTYFLKKIEVNPGKYFWETYKNIINLKPDELSFRNQKLEEL